MEGVTDIRVSIVIPAYNEGRRLGPSLARLVAAIPAGTEVIVVDDGSTDDTCRVAVEQLSAFSRGTVMRLPWNSGKGAAVRAGVGLAQGRSIVFMDADLSTDLDDLPRLLAGLEEADIVVGSRSAAGSVVESCPPLRVVMGRTFNRFVRGVTGIPSLDTQCGFKAFRASVAKLLFSLQRVEGFAFDVELFVLARRLGFRVLEVPVRWKAAEGSQVRKRDPLLMLKDVVGVQVRSALFRGRTADRQEPVLVCSAGSPVVIDLRPHMDPRSGLQESFHPSPTVLEQA